MVNNDDNLFVGHQRLEFGGKLADSYPHLFLQLFLYRLFQLGRLGGRLKTAHDLAFAVNQELCEVPLDVGLRCVIGICLGEHLVQQFGERMLGCEAGKASLARQPFVDGMGILAVHFNLRHQGEGDAMILAAKLLDLLVGTGFLMPELVARETDDDQSAVLVLLIEGFQSVVLRREAALRGCVDNEEHLAFVVGKAHFLALVREGVELIDGVHGVCFTR